VFLLFIAVGTFVMEVHLSEIHYMHTMVGKEIATTMRVEKMQQRTWQTHVIARDTQSNIRYLIRDDLYPEVRYGDEIAVTCTPEVAESFEDFDYAMYLATQRIIYICDAHTYSIVGHKDTLFTRLIARRHVMEQVVNTIIPAPQAGLANGLLFGGSDRLSERVQDAFARTGMTHIVAVSGYNVSVIIVAMTSVGIFVGLRRRSAIVLAIISIILFVALIEFPASGVRAAIMGIMVLVAATYGRITHAYSAIIFAAAVMLWHNPLLLRYDVGFQLSFLATLGIVAVYPILDRLLIRGKRSFGLVELIILTVSAQVFVAPVIIYHFHTFSVISIVANVLVLPIIPLTMLLVGVLVISHSIVFPIALVSGWGAYFLLSYELLIIDLLAELPWSNISLSDPSVWYIVLYYITVWLMVYMIHKKYRL
jgi:competence protein ComEC